jgi:hypothetical protein
VRLPIRPGEGVFEPPIGGAGRCAGICEIPGREVARRTRPPVIGEHLEARILSEDGADGRRDLVQADCRSALVDQQPVVVEVSMTREARLEHVAVFRDKRLKI